MFMQFAAYVLAKLPYMKNMSSDVFERRLSHLALLGTLLNLYIGPPMLKLDTTRAGGLTFLSKRTNVPVRRPSTLHAVIVVTVLCSNACVYLKGHGYKAFARLHCLSGLICALHCCLILLQKQSLKVYRCTRTITCQSGYVRASVAVFHECENQVLGWAEPTLKVFCLSHQHALDIKSLI